jgi:hypothetical protein
MTAALRRFAPLVLALIGVALIVTWLTNLGHTSSVARVTASPASSAPLMGPAIPAGQQRLAAGETAHLAKGLQVTVFGPQVGVPAGSAARLGDLALIPVAFTIRVTAGTVPVTVSPSDFVLTMPGMSTTLGRTFGAATALLHGATPGISALPFTVPAGQTVQHTLPLLSLARTGQIAYAPGGATSVAWVFTAEDD